MFYVLLFYVPLPKRVTRHVRVRWKNVKGLEEVEELGRNECTLHR